MADLERLRVSDTEREDALTALGTHLSEGRLDVVEYSDRSASIGAARTIADLRGAFTDLPEPHPEVLRAGRSTAGSSPGSPQRPMLHWLAGNGRWMWAIPAGLLLLIVLTRFVPYLAPLALIVIVVLGVLGRRR